jgi:hypothetical protein
MCVAFWSACSLERKIGVEIDLCGCGVTRLFFAVVHVCCATSTYFETRYWTESDLSRPARRFGNKVRCGGVALGREAHVSLCRKGAQGTTYSIDEINGSRIDRMGSRASQDDIQTGGGNWQDQVNTMVPLTNYSY